MIENFKRLEPFEKGAIIVALAFSTGAAFATASWLETRLQEWLAAGCPFPF